MLGVGAGFVLPAIFVGDRDTLAIHRSEAKVDIFNSLLAQAILSTVIFIIAIFFFRERPLTPPSSSCDVPKSEFKKSVKEFFANKNMVLLLINQGCISGVFNTLGNCVAGMAKSVHFDPAYNPLFGALFITGGIIGSFVFGFWVAKCKKRLRAVKVISVCSLVTIMLLLGSFFARIMVLCMVLCFFIGASMIPI